jgi:hypothetical protein
MGQAVSVSQKRKLKSLKAAARGRQELIRQFPNCLCTPGPAGRLIAMRLRQSRLFYQQKMAKVLGTGNKFKPHSGSRAPRQLMGRS